MCVDSNFELTIKSLLDQLHNNNMEIRGWGGWVGPTWVEGQQKETQQNKEL